MPFLDRFLWLRLLGALVIWVGLPGSPCSSRRVLPENGLA